MENIMIDLIKIIVIISFIIDISGITISIKKLMWRLVMGKHIPFTNDFEIPLMECSLCITFWSVLIYSISNDVLIINSIFLAVASAYIVGFVTILLNTILDLFKLIISKINRYE